MCHQSIWPASRLRFTPYALRFTPYALRLTPYALRPYALTLQISLLRIDTIDGLTLCSTLVRLCVIKAFGRLQGCALRLTPFAVRFTPYALRLTPYALTPYALTLQISLLRIDTIDGLTLCSTLVSLCVIKAFGRLQGCALRLAPYALRLTPCALRLTHYALTP